jgi:arsenite-transporting ATPase
MLHLISADLPSDALALVGHLQRRLASQGDPAQLIDLSGQGLLASPDWGGPKATIFEHEPYLQLAWGRIKPELSDWIDLLQLQDAQPERCPPLPGLGQLLQWIALADWLAPGVGEGATDETVVVLPPLHQALELLELAGRGPDLLDAWLEPLLTWWQESRRSLSRLDLVLRLSLPDGDVLRLNPLWRQRLGQLAYQLADPNRHQLLCVLDGGLGQTTFLGDRLCRTYLKGFQPARLWLAGSPVLPVLAGLAAIRGPLVIGHGHQLHDGGSQLEDWLDQPWQAEATLDWGMGDGAARCRLLLPGLRKALLKVQQMDQDLLIQVGGSSRIVPMPRDLAGQQCTGARISGRYLLLKFQ